VSSNLIDNEALDVLLMLLIKMSNSSNEIDELTKMHGSKTRLDYRSAYHLDAGLRDSREESPRMLPPSKRARIEEWN